ncbi:MAG: tetraacyldisaccharide 4'-kinase [Muribaculaceae bacterium]|nr:tetraacyldisaccharide 4'-kinase [Muribaculaceae bacterium]
MSEGKSTSQKILSGLLLKPLSLVYGAVTSTRNKMFDFGILTQRKFDIPVLVVGNISVGGTGKTPHTEYLIRLLSGRYKVGVLSRGYNRKTSGFILADDKANAATIGDESYQIYRKFGHQGVMVAVCEDRCEGIDHMREIDPTLNLIILDDAFQHRYVKPKVSVVLTEYSRPVYSDSMLPAGRLRENKGALHRADIVVVTKCPSDMKQLEYRLFVKNLRLYPYQKLYFSKYIYEDIHPVFPDFADGFRSISMLDSSDYVIALAGIAHPTEFIKHIKSTGAKVSSMIFADHHNYSRNDMADLVAKIKSSPNPKKTIVITTEKDAMRLKGLSGLPKGLKTRLYYLPITVKLIPNVAESNVGAEDFSETISALIDRDDKE